MARLTDWLTESEKYEFCRSYGVDAEGEFVERQDDYYISLLGTLHDILKMYFETNSQEEYVRVKRALQALVKGLLLYSQKETADAFKGVRMLNNQLYVASIYYLFDYTAVASWVMSDIQMDAYEDESAQLLSFIVSGGKSAGDREVRKHYLPVFKPIEDFILKGDDELLNQVVKAYYKKYDERDFDSPTDFYMTSVLRCVLKKFCRDNIWQSLRKVDIEFDWKAYARHSYRQHIFSFLPSQQDAIDKGLLSFDGAFSLKMPTSAGKSYITELLIYQELTKDPDSKVLYLAPLRSLSRELGEKFEKIKKFFGYKVAVKYGGGSATDNLLSDEIQLLVSTPEFFISLEEGIEDLLERYKLIICDEGQLLDDYSRGINYEMLLTRLRKNKGKRFLFISAIIPNIQDINEWLGGTNKLIGDSNYRPSSIKLSKAVVNGNDLDLLVYDQDYSSVAYRIDRFVDSGGFVFDISKNRDMACALAIQAVNAGSVMLYVSFKRGARGCEYFSKVILNQLEQNKNSLNGFSKNNVGRNQMLQYVRYQCGDDYLLTKCIANGFAYHHADIPQDLRELLEESIDDGIIQLVVCTSTLAEGVNLPLKTIVLGNVIDPMYVDKGACLSKATLKNIIGRVGRAGRERYGLVIFPDNKKKLPFSLVQDALKDIGIPEVQGTLFRLVNYLVSTKKVADINDLNDLLGDNDLVKAIDMMITKSTNAQNLEELSIDDLISDSLAFKLGNNQQKEMLKTVFQARYSRLKEQFDAQEYALLQATGLSVMDLNKVYEIIDDSDAGVFSDANYQEWPVFLDYLLGKLYELPTVQEDLADDSHKHIGDYINNENLMKRICILWMEGLTYKDIAIKASNDPLDVDKVIVSIIFMQNCICRHVRPLVNYMKVKYEVDNSFLDSFHQMMNMGIATEEQVYMCNHGLRNRLCLHAMDDYLQSKGYNLLNLNSIRAFFRERRAEMTEFLLDRGYPEIAIEKLVKWTVKVS